MVPYDVASMYTRNIPLIDTLNIIIKDYVNNDLSIYKQFKHKKYNHHVSKY